MEPDEAPQSDPLLSQAEAQAPALFDNAPEIIYTHDLEGNFVSINRAAETITGYSRQELAGLHFGSVVAPEYRELAKQQIMRKLAGEEVTTYEIEIIRKDGTPVPLEISTWLLRRDGNPVGIQGIARDITERRNAEIAAQESERRFRVLFENSSDAIMLWSAKGRVTCTRHPPSNASWATPNRRSPAGWPWSSSIPTTPTRPPGCGPR